MCKVYFHNGTCALMLLCSNPFAAYFSRGSCCNPIVRGPDPFFAVFLLSSRSWVWFLSDTKPFFFISYLSPSTLLVYYFCFVFLDRIRFKLLFLANNLTSLWSFERNFRSLFFFEGNS